MDNDVWKAIKDYIERLAGTDRVEAQKYIMEITSNMEFNGHLGQYRGDIGRKRFLTRGMGIGTILGVDLYALCRNLKPDTVVETRVASGMSSSYILYALEKNKHGTLHSIDLP